MKKIILYCLIIVLVLSVVVCGYYLSIVSGTIFSLGSNPPEPEIKYGEFPISITYEVDGETKKNEDIIICEYDGIENFGSGGRRRKWKCYLKSGNERLVLLNGELQDTIFEISDFYGSPNYYMGEYIYDLITYKESMKNDDELNYIEWKNGIQRGDIISYNEALERFGLRIIDIQYSEPIKNSFK